MKISVDSRLARKKLTSKATHEKFTCEAHD